MFAGSRLLESVASLNRFPTKNEGTRFLTWWVRKESHEMNGRRQTTQGGKCGVGSGGGTLAAREGNYLEVTWKGFTWMWKG